MGEIEAHLHRGPALLRQVAPADLRAHYHRRPSARCTGGHLREEIHALAEWTRFDLEEGAGVARLPVLKGILLDLVDDGAAELASHDRNVMRPIASDLEGEALPHAFTEFHQLAADPWCCALPPGGSRSIPTGLPGSPMMTARRIRLGSNPRSGLAAGSHRLHSQIDAGPVSVRGKIAGRVTLAINPLDARSRGIGDGEVVRVFNARGACFAGVSVTEAVRPASFGSPAVPGTTPRATRTSRPAPILPSSRQPSRDPAPQPAGYPDKADAAERFRPTLRWRELDSNLRFLARAVSVLPVRDRCSHPAPSNGESVSRNSGKFKGRPRGGGVLRRGSGHVLALMMMRGEEREVDCFADLGTAQGEQTTPGKFTAATD